MEDFSSNQVETIRPQWFHPYLKAKDPVSPRLLQSFAYDYFLKFLPFFRNQPEGDLAAGTDIAFSKRMRQRLGAADLHRHTIDLNEKYFCKDPRLLPYTLFHELVHLWLYDCYYDPGHTQRFYKKMDEFLATGLPIDKDVHIHKRIPGESRYVFICPGCEMRWYVPSIREQKRYCGHCFDSSNKRLFPVGFFNHFRHSHPAGRKPLEYFRCHAKEISKI